MENAEDLAPGADYPRTFQEVDEWFRGDAACREYIRRLRWPGGFICPHCGWTGEPWVTSRGLLASGCRARLEGRDPGWDQKGVPVEHTVFGGRISHPAFQPGRSRQCQKGAPLSTSVGQPA